MIPATDLFYAINIEGGWNYEIALMKWFIYWKSGQVDVNCYWFTQLQNRWWNVENEQIKENVFVIEIILNWLDLYCSY